MHMKILKKKPAFCPEAFLQPEIVSPKLDETSVNSQMVHSELNTIGTWTEMKAAKYLDEPVVFSAIPKIKALSTTKSKPDPIRTEIAVLQSKHDQLSAWAENNTGLISRMQEVGQAVCVSDQELIQKMCLFIVTQNALNKLRKEYENLSYTEFENLFKVN